MACLSDYRTTDTRGHLSTYFLDSILFEYVASLTIRGFLRTTISNKSINPNGAITYSSPSLCNRTATDVAVSGHVATASSRKAAAQVVARTHVRTIDGQPHYSTVRTQLRILEGKRYVRHEEESLKYVYLPAVAKDEVGQSALKQLIDAFYDGSTENVVAALLGVEGSKLSQKKLDRIAEMFEKARKGAKR
jgi:predicted transcriptional regulator